jgi:hypothetical protein
MTSTAVRISCDFGAPDSVTGRIRAQAMLWFTPFGQRGRTC